MDLGVVVGGGGVFVPPTLMGAGTGMPLGTWKSIVQTIQINTKYRKFFRIFGSRIVFGFDLRKRA